MRELIAIVCLWLALDLAGCVPGWTPGPGPAPETDLATDARAAAELVPDTLRPRLKQVGQVFAAQAAAYRGTSRDPAELVGGTFGELDRVLGPEAPQFDAWRGRLLRLLREHFAPGDPLAKYVEAWDVLGRVYQG